MNIVGYGGGVNSTAMLVGMCKKGIPADLILFADPGGEQPYTYEYLPIMDDWLARHGMPRLQTVYCTDKNGERLRWGPRKAAPWLCGERKCSGMSETCRLRRGERYESLRRRERECLRSGTLPAIAYGYKKCSLKHKIAPQEKFCNHYRPCREVWARGEKVFKYIGYDVGETQRREGAREYDEADPKYTKVYALMDWGWTREDCVTAIRREGLPLLGKSSCFFCPSMKKREIRTLYHRHRDLYERAIAIEDGAKPNLTTVKGLGRNWAWRDFVAADLNQQVMCWMFPEDDLPCNCHDGG